VTSEYRGTQGAAGSGSPSAGLDASAQEGLDRVVAHQVIEAALPVVRRVGVPSAPPKVKGGERELAVAAASQEVLVARISFKLIDFLREVDQVEVSKLYIEVGGEHLLFDKTCAAGRFPQFHELAVESFLSQGVDLVCNGVLGRAKT